jgi:uncharacterized protein DUF6932
MTIPTFTIDGILPPFIGTGPGDDPAFMSPYNADAIEVVTVFGTSGGRRQILSGWLNHRAALRSIGINRGFQWLDGSFLEEKEPRDLDIVSFFHFPENVKTEVEQLSLWTGNPSIFDHLVVKTTYSLDAFFIPLEGSPEALISLSRYYLQLFSHQRESFLWKGMIQVRLDETNDASASEQLLIPQTQVQPGENQL